MSRSRLLFDVTFRKSVNAGSWIAEKRELSAIANAAVMAVQTQLARCELAERTSDRNGCVWDQNWKRRRVIGRCGEAAGVDDRVDDLLRVVVHCIAEK